MGTVWFSGDLRGLSPSRARGSLERFDVLQRTVGFRCGRMLRSRREKDDPEGEDLEPRTTALVSFLEGLRHDARFLTYNGNCH